MHSSRRSLLAALIVTALASSSGMGCPGTELRFLTPQPNQLSQAGQVYVLVALPVGGSVGFQIFQSDCAGAGADNEVTGDFTVNGAVASGYVTAPEGEHSLCARADVGAHNLIAIEEEVTYEAVDLENPNECQILNDAHCALPYPTTQFMKRDLFSLTGWRMNVPQAAVPQPIDPDPNDEDEPEPIPASLMNHLDGTSPTTQILMQFPGGVDVAQSNLSRLLPPQPATSPPWLDTRTYDASSLDPNHPTLLFDWDTGEQIAHWVEVDARNPDLSRQATILRPAVSLTPGHRYIVAVRNLKHADGTDVEPEAPFTVLRDGRPTDITKLFAMKIHYVPLFARLAELGVPRSNLILAFDFVVQSEHMLTHQMLAMRDQGLAWLATQDQETSPTFTVDSVVESACDDEYPLWKIIEGTFQSPLFLDGQPVSNGVQFLNVDANDHPIQNGTMDAPYTIGIPCVLHPDYEGDVTDVYPLLLGHGIFGNGQGMVEFVPPLASRITAGFAGERDVLEWNYVAGATDWTGWSSSDIAWVVSRIILDGNTGFSQLHNFEAFPDRHKQGQLNTLILARMMKQGAFNVDPTFENAFPGTESPEYYYGISMGGVQGLFHSAISTDIEKFGIDVGSINFLLLLQRSTQFPGFEIFLSAAGFSDPLKILLGLTMLHELWVSSEPAGYARHITSDPLPGTSAKKILMTPAWLDHQVSNQGSEITARTLGLSTLGSLQQGMLGIPDAASNATLDSAYVMYDTGALDILNPAHTNFIPPLANKVVTNSSCDPHGGRPAIPAGIHQFMTFARPGGQIENFCTDDGICNASEPWEIPQNPSSPSFPTATPCQP